MNFFILIMSVNMLLVKLLNQNWKVGVPKVYLRILISNHLEYNINDNLPKIIINKFK